MIPMAFIALRMVRTTGYGLFHIEPRPWVSKYPLYQHKVSDHPMLTGRCKRPLRRLMRVCGFSQNGGFRVFQFYVSVIEKASETMKGVEGEPLGFRLTGS